MHTIDWWSWTCAKCDFKVKSHFTVNSQQSVAETLVRLHIRSHEETPVVSRSQFKRVEAQGENPVIMKSKEQQARDLLERLGHPRAQELTAGDVVELANLLNPVLDAPTERRLREYLWLSHGHTRVYGDDGEMQCGDCLPVYDYKRAPLADVVRTAIASRAKVNQEALAEADVEKKAEIDKFSVLRNTLFDVTVRCTCDFRDCNYHHTARSILGIPHNSERETQIEQWDKEKNHGHY